MSKPKRKWYPPTPAQEWKKIEADYKLYIIKEYAKAGDPAAIAALAVLEAAKEEANETDPTP